ncbi:endonuclease [Nonlabens spongiae]|uniref:Endonuclease n=1 Tax=Nonlabens spongiae TaxID=331648 RepID=A0A1W6MN53_9FLAO|nr:GIY-YIG nuclease family protein [Nonlabens spongiae]ARN79025.1 endonuclease [Nonlabens spongiae]
MLEFVVYVLWSPAHGKRYVGMTSNLIKRFASHNKLGTKGWTIRYRPWKVVHVEFYETKRDALLREKLLKTGKGREWIDSNVDFK